MSRLLVGVLLAALAAGVTTFGAQAEGRGCRVVSADNPMVSSSSYGVARCHARGARYYTRSYLGEEARGYERRVSSDPMVWSDSQWRGTLFDGYVRTANDNYDRRFRRASPADVHRIVRVVVAEGPAENVDKAAPSKPKRARLIDMRTRGDAEQYLENSSKFTGHRCGGVLLITWKAGGARSQCHDSPSRIRRAR